MSTPTAAAEPTPPPATGSHWWLVLNGKAAGNDEVREAVTRWRGRGIAISVRVTWEAGDADRYVDEALAAGAQAIIAAGGDGTLSAVAAALAGRDEDAAGLPSLGVVPLGTANDFATAAGIPDEVEAALELVQSAVPQAVDLLRVDGAGDCRWCANLASGGFGTEVTVETNEGLKRVLGGLAYLVTGIARLGRIDPISARVSGVATDGAPFEWQGGFIALGVGNGRQAGGGQVLCPEATIDDGRLDLTIIPELRGEVGATVSTLMAEGREGALERIAVRRQLPAVEIAAQAPFVLNLDGEPLESDHFRVACVARRVRMHLPPGCPLLGTPATPAAAEPSLPDADGAAGPVLAA